MSATQDAVNAVRLLLRQGRLAEAAWPLQKLSRRAGGEAAFEAVAARRDRLRGAPAEAMARVRAALQLHRDEPALWLELGLCEQALGIAGDGRAAFERAIALPGEALGPDVAPALGLVAGAMMAEGRWGEAGALLDRLAAMEPCNASVQTMRGMQQMVVGQLREAGQSFGQAQALEPADPDPSNSLCFLSLYRDDLTPAQVLEVHRDWGRRHGGCLTAPPAARTHRRGGRLRIGYVSADLVTHSVTVFLEPVLAAHDRARVEVFCYDSSRGADAVTARLQGLAEHWRHIARLDDGAAAALIQADDIDLLIDLGGHTARNRLGIFTHRPGRRAATWLGYPGTTGLPSVDWRIGDPVADAPGAEAWHAEGLCRLPQAFFTYAGIRDAPNVGEPPAACGGGVVFGAPTNITKVSARTLAAWAGVLRGTPGSRLEIKASAAGVPTVQARIREAMAAGGVDPARVQFEGRGDFAQYIGLHAGWDLALDTWPFNGHTTTCHALWMGVPVVTRAGQMHAGRMGASVMAALGLTQELVGEDDEGFIAQAVALASDVGRLRELRRTMRERILASPMADATGFTRGLEAAMERMAGGGPRPTV